MIEQNEITIEKINDTHVSKELLNHLKIMKKVIDGDNMIVLETFEARDSESIKEKYENIETWEDVDFDLDGDLILYKEI